ncbi:LutC/YkgG family protein [Desulfogranum japonicum]|uniref:LutC/YkgG family protein n=1 Tax=Desulfogranum japonicum TaxID=231447 RepID=UPI0004263884|nr:lactate utilization protein [Desulfogranum japonicum]
MYDQFRTKAEGVSAEVHRFQTQTEAMDFILEFMKQENVSDTPNQYAVWAQCPFLEQADKGKVSDVNGLYFDINRERANQARVGISQVDWALADTGTLVQDASAIDKRLVSTLPSIHIALLPSSAVLPDMASWLSCVNPKNTGYISMITGPSRTADIERVLTIGVHGPERLVIVCVDELGGDN